MSRKWTADEVETLIRLWAAGETIEAIAEEIGRTPHGVSSAASDRGLPHRPRRGTPRSLWTEADEARALALRAEGWSYARIGAALGRGETGVADRIARLTAPRAPKVVPPPAGKKRMCLMCGKGMWSSHPGQRICLPCKDTDDWRAA